MILNGPVLPGTYPGSVRVRCELLPSQRSSSSSSPSVRVYYSPLKVYFPMIAAASTTLEQNVGSMGYLSKAELACLLVSCVYSSLFPEGRLQIPVRLYSWTMNFLKSQVTSEFSGRVYHARYPPLHRVQYLAAMSIQAEKNTHATHL